MSNTHVGTQVSGWGPVSLPWERNRAERALDSARRALEAYPDQNESSPTLGSSGNGSGNMRHLDPLAS